MEIYEYKYLIKFLNIKILRKFAKIFRNSNIGISNTYI